MNIIRIKTHILRVPLGDQRFYSSQCAFPERNSLLVEVETDDGVVGWGEGGQYGPPGPVAACIEQVLGPKLIGRDPMDVAALWEEGYNGTRDFGQKGAYIEALSALDIALWDIKGQALGVPVWNLLGGAVRRRVAAYATGCYYRGEDVLDYSKALDALKEEASGYVRDGFSMLKVKMGLLPVPQDAVRLKAIREAIGPDAGLLVDCNHAYNAATAIRMGRHLEEADVLFFEEPVPPEDQDGYRRVRAALDVPIAGGECEYTRYGYRDFIAGGCADIIQPDLCVCGGFTAFLQITALASSYGVRVVPHVWGSGIALATALQALAVIPVMPHTAHPVPLQNEPVVEYDRNYNPLRDDLLEENFALADSSLDIPDAPGLGVTMKRDVLEKYE